MSDELTARLAQIRLLALDVDGTLTDGAVTFASDGAETKTFHIHDGLGIVLARHVGLETAWITGRTSPITERRARELGVVHLYQGVRDKTDALADLATRTGVAVSQIAYMGDDLNDLPLLRLVGAALAPRNAVADVKSAAHFVTPRAGGAGAVRDALELILRARGDYQTALDLYLASLSSASQNILQ